MVPNGPFVIGRSGNREYDHAVRRVAQAQIELARLRARRKPMLCIVAGRSKRMTVTT